MTAPTHPIEGKVARVLNAREIVINRGSMHGVTAGMKFAVIDERTENIEDPDTREVLGSVDRPKMVLEIVQVQEKLALARTFRKRRESTAGGSLSSWATFQQMFEPPRVIERYETPSVDDEGWQDLDERESIVRTGDLVREVVPTAASVARGAAE